MQTGLFDWQFRFEKLDKNGDPLGKLNDVVSWESFRPTLNAVHEKERKFPIRIRRPGSVAFVPPFWLTFSDSRWSRSTSQRREPFGPPSS